jgi:hypothetical protein
LQMFDMATAVFRVTAETAVLTVRPGKSKKALDMLYVGFHSAMGIIEASFEAAKVPPIQVGSVVRVTGVLGVYERRMYIQDCQIEVLGAMGLLGGGGAPAETRSGAKAEPASAGGPTRMK